MTCIAGASHDNGQAVKQVGDDAYEFIDDLPNDES